MYFKVIKGKEKNKLFIGIKVNEETEEVTAQDGTIYHFKDINPLTPEEEAKYIKVEKIF